MMMSASSALRVMMMLDLDTCISSTPCAYGLSTCGAKYSYSINAFLPEYALKSMHPSPRSMVKAISACSTRERGVLVIHGVVQEQNRNASPTAKSEYQLRFIQITFLALNGRNLKLADRVSSGDTIALEYPVYN
ncbi:hypothetical protein SDC9_204293 [bioreactor metagenome]|uniref:Uncharacterized protein n=1 Tax=bioreactor metagenome TaxID=1076179 RepID=A0A645JAR6_9ZZZZ